MTHLMKLACILGFFGLGSCATQPTLAQGPGGDHPESELRARLLADPEPAVLFIGNSYSFGVPKAFGKVAADHGKSLRIGHSTFGGWSLARHAANEPTLRKIRDGQWAVVVIQEQSEIPAMSPRRRAELMFPPLRKLVTEVRAHGAVPVLYQTWGRRDGDKSRRHDDFQAMNARLREGYQEASRNAGNLVVVPVGDAWQREVDVGNLTRLFTEDGSHPSAYGNEVTARIFYQTFFGG